MKTTAAPVVLDKLVFTLAYETIGAEKKMRKK